MSDKLSEMNKILDWISEGEKEFIPDSGSACLNGTAAEKTIPNSNPSKQLEAIAITGLSGFFPESMNVQEFWDHLDNDRSMIREIPTERFEWKKHYSKTGEAGTMRTRHGGFIPDIASFDPTLFNMLPAEAAEIDPRQRLLLMSVWRTLEDAGYDPLSLKKSNTGVFIGCETNQYAQIMRDNGIPSNGLFNQTDSMISNRLSYFFDFAGPSEFVNTMCSGFAVALHRAVVALRAGTIDRAIVGAANIILSPELLIALSGGEQLCTGELVRSFGKDGDGYLSAEGVGTLLIERISDAKAANRYSYATIKHAVVNYNGRGGMSIAAPNTEAHAELMKNCYREAGIDPRNLQYIEAQGMGLPVADIAEWTAMNRALTELASEQGITLKPGSCSVSSLKPMTGHMHAASSLAALLKVIRSFQTRKIHKILGYDQPNEFCNMTDAPCRIIKETETWPDSEHPRLAAIHSYGSGGNNAHLLLEEVMESEQMPKAVHTPTPFRLQKYWFKQNITNSKTIDSNSSHNVTLPAINHQENEVIDEIRKLLGLEENQFDANTAFSSLGVDSAAVGIFTSGLNTSFGITIPKSDVYSYPTPEKMAQYILSKRQKNLIKSTDTPERNQPDTKVETDDIAIIGMYVRVAGAENTQEFWSNLQKGESSLSEIPEKRRSEAFNKLKHSRGGFISEVDHFDPLFFGISPREAEFMDPRHRVLLESSYAAIEDSGYDPKSWKGKRNGIFIGLEESDYPLTERSSITSIHSGSAPARIGYFLDTKGPLLSLSTACSSSLVAIHYACNSILNGESETALAGGCAIISDPAQMIANLARMGDMLSPDSTCYAFDDRANGMVLGEGVGVVILKRLSQAIRDKDPIHGIIKATGINYDGKTNGLTAPSGIRQQELYEDVIRKSGFNADSIGHIVAHGTGTALGDPIECNALINAYEAHTDQKHFCALTSVKTTIGHTLAASGVINLVAATLSIKNKQIPATLNYASANEDIRFENSPFYVNTALRQWEAPNRNAAVSAFGHTGTNAHAVISEYADAIQTENNRKDTVYLLALSAKNAAQLKEYTARLLRFVTEQNTDLDLANLAYTYQTGREAMDVRLGIITHSQEDLKRQLQDFLDEKSTPETMFSGSIIPHREHPDFQTIHQWWKEGTFKELLNTWVEGAEIDWKLLQENNAVRRINAPTYPFEKGSYWIDEKKTIAVTPAENKQSTVNGQSAVGISPYETLSYIRSQIANFLKIPVDRINNTVSLEDYGLDSILTGELTAIFQRNFPKIDSTLFFQCQTIDEIVAYLTQKGHLETFRPEKTNNAGISEVKTEANTSDFDHRSVSCIKPSATATTRVIAFSPFGFGIKSLAWMNRLPEDVEVWSAGSTEYPEWDALINDLTESIKVLFDKPVVVWGHSMGGIIAFEVLHRLETLYSISAKQFIVSSSAAPRVFERLKFSAPFYEIEESMSTSSIETELISNHYVVPKESGLPVISPEALMNDVRLCKTYTFDNTKIINTPIYMVQASNDILIRDPAVIVQWQELTTSRCRYEEVEGTHLFFIRPQQGFVDLLNNCCTEETTEQSLLVTPGVYELDRVFEGTADVHLYPLGTTPKGFIIYTESGHMAAHLWHPKRRNSLLESKLTEEELLTYVAYTGNYQVDKGIVSHSVKLSLQPDTEGKILTRYLEKHNDNLTLLTSPLILSEDGQFSSADYQKVSWKALPTIAKAPAETLTGCWQLSSISGLRDSLCNQAFKGQCIITADGYISLLMNHQDRAPFFYKNFALASPKEIKNSLQSCVILLGKLSTLNENCFAVDVLSHQTAYPMNLSELQIDRMSNELTLSWSTTNEPIETIVTKWELAENNSPE